VADSAGTAVVMTGADRAIRWSAIAAVAVVALVAASV
jgi:hypothetical protein